jgi:hypothetical protein
MPASKSKRRGLCLRRIFLLPPRSESELDRPLVLLSSRCQTERLRYRPYRSPQAWLEASSNNLPCGLGRTSDLPLHRHTSSTHSHTHPLYTGVGTYFLDSTMSNLRSIRNSDAAPRLDRSQQMLLPKTNLHPSNSSKQYVCYAYSRSF